MHDGFTVFVNNIYPVSYSAVLPLYYDHDNLTLKLHQKK